MGEEGFIGEWRLRAAACAAAIIVLGVCSAGSLAAAPRARTASAPACSAAGLVVWLNTTGDGTAGSIYYTLEFTNLSRRACTLTGYPGVSAINLAGHRIGAPASRDTAYGARAVTLGAGASATATLRIVDSANFPTSACGPVRAAGLRVYPPNQTASKIVPFPFRACAHSADGVLSVRAVR
jgi:hypothetical protein